MLVTEMGVFEFRNGKFVLTEISGKISLEELRAKTEAEYEVDKNLKKI